MYDPITALIWKWMDTAAVRLRSSSDLASLGPFCSILEIAGMLHVFSLAGWLLMLFAF